MAKKSIEQKEVKQKLEKGPTKGERWRKINGLSEHNELGRITVWSVERPFVDHLVDGLLETDLQS